jgi:ribosomal protein S18 acetylase RimI-like enzyme
MSVCQQNTPDGGRLAKCVGQPDLTRLIFDSDVLGVSVARVEGVATAKNLATLVTKARKLSVDVFYATLDGPCHDLVTQSPHWTLYECPVSVTLRLNRGDHGSTRPTPSPVRIVSIPSNTNRLDDIKKLALMAGENSRFRGDPRLTDAQFNSMYHAWAENSVARAAASDVFAAVDGAGDVVGLITVKLLHACKAASIGLLAVSGNCRRGGVGASLMAHATEYAFDQGAAWMDVVTQEDNEAAVRFYTRQGFYKVERRHTFHVWPELPEATVTA